MAKKLSKEEWERRIKDVVIGRYDFIGWDGEFKNCSSMALVRCSVDNYEWRSSAHCLVNKGSGCPQCSGNRRWTAEERIDQINKLENIEFVSWDDGYKNGNSRANVKCKIDGFAWLTNVGNLVNHGKGCHQCANHRRWTSEERIEQINSLDSIEFVSWIGKYKTCESIAKVRCNVDGFEWIATVNNIVNVGNGCPKCAKYGYDKSKTGYLYAIRSECGQYVKVGISNKPNRRHKELEKRTTFKFNIVEQFEGGGDKIAELERYFHGKYERAGFVGFDGATEWLVCSDDLLSELRGVSIEHE